ncbi:MAG: SMP-30/gluconolactonase/LRE family protein [Deltaproteobacteria bacterium]|nr:SMP-30/gluconolactonase/LRE family protein [Deltaproteobacteria bacterium]
MSDTARFELLASGYGLIEGPTVAPEGGLYFSDVLGGGIFHLAAGGAVTTVVPKRRGVGGIAAHADGGIVCSGRDLIHVKDGVTRTLFAIDGLPGWNDLCTDARGRVYAGAVRFRVFDRDVKVVPGECWRIDAAGKASQIYDDVIHANGIAVSPDERWLAHSDTRGARVIVHALREDGSVAERRHIPVSGHADGLAFDETGAFWVALAGAGRIDRFALTGEKLGSLAVPARMVTSLCFAGSDLRDLIVVTADNTLEPAGKGALLRTRAPVAGARVHPARV